MEGQFSQVKQRPHQAQRWGTDIHCHCLPGLDDGPADMAEALRLCRLLADEGVRVVAATPHQLGRYDGAYTRADILERLRLLQEQLTAAEVPLLVVPGADVRVDERLVGLLETGAALTLADAHEYVLLELPHDVFIDLRPLIAVLRKRGIASIITHPERHGTLQRSLEKARSWHQAGALFQITAGSLLGTFGPPAEHAAWAYIEAEVASLVASDAHDTVVRPPLLRAAHQALTRRLGEAWADRLCLHNPRRLLPDEVVAAVETRELEARP